MAVEVETTDGRRTPSLGELRIWTICVNSLVPIGAFTAVVVFWAFSVRYFEVPKYLLPGPGDIIVRLIETREPLWRNGLITLQEIFYGFFLTVASAIPLGLLIALSPLARRVIYPILVFLQLVPKIAIAPLFIVWVGFGMESKVLLTVMMTFFPLLLASIAGFQTLDPRLLYLTRSMGASAWQTFRNLRLPAALPIVFSGLKASATIAATAAIVAEFVGANQGLGYYLLQATSNLDTTLVFAILAVLTIIGLSLNLLVELAEYLMTPWRRSQREN
ncbi:ABC transporter permease [Aurantimonas sp. VKM B-3413]|uniref:ABC transporter permease n=1 Tax=Aurantimonas sp. VKM B-3413 TaxID=2779401 RepID=UPI001E2BD015|nr:ABC transporter permease [Aurantimonas sp. VKM B-3413]MCB8837009.1 ABC transporter permease [Aurantimonas sp. VKM B-3413]